MYILSSFWICIHFYVSYANWVFSSFQPITPHIPVFNSNVSALLSCFARLGRRKTLYLTFIILIAVAFGVCWAPEYVSFVILQFIIGAACHGAFMICCVLGQYYIFCLSFGVCWAPEYVSFVILQFIIGAACNGAFMICCVLVSCYILWLPFSVCLAPDYVSCMFLESIIHIKMCNIRLPYVKHALYVRYKTYVKRMDRAPYV